MNKTKHHAHHVCAQKTLRSPAGGADEEEADDEPPGIGEVA